MLTPQKKWRAIALATLALMPAYWLLLAGLVAVASDDDTGGPAPAPAILLGLVLFPVAFTVLARASMHPRPVAAVAKAFGVFLLVGFPVSAVAADAVTGIVAAAGAGGIVALRADATHEWRMRALAVVVAAAYTYVLARAAGAIVVLTAPIFPFTGIGVADHIAERREERGAAPTRA